MSLSPLSLALEMAPIARPGRIGELLEVPRNGANGDVVGQGRLEIPERPHPSIAVTAETPARSDDLDLCGRNAVRPDGDGSLLDGAVPDGPGGEAIHEGKGSRLRFRRPEGRTSQVVRGIPDLEIVAPRGRFRRDGDRWVWSFRDLEPTLADD